MSTVTTQKFAEFFKNPENLIKKHQAHIGNSLTRGLKKEGYSKEDIEVSVACAKEEMLKALTDPCDCKTIVDIRGKCHPLDFTFKKCPERVDTAIWFIENGYFERDDFEYFTEDEKEILEMELTSTRCDVCHRESNFMETVGSCGGCSADNMCSQCGYFNEHSSEWYCEPCRDKAIDAGEWSQEESDDE